MKRRPLTRALLLLLTVALSWMPSNVRADQGTGFEEPLALPYAMLLGDAAPFAGILLTKQRIFNLVLKIEKARLMLTACEEHTSSVEGAMDDALAQAEEAILTSLEAPCDCPVPWGRYVAFTGSGVAIGVIIMVLATGGM